MDEYISILLLPEHVVASPANLPLLKGTQTILNEAYKKTYCARSDIFGDDHVRLADPAQFADIVKGDGFMVVVLRVEPTSEASTGGAKPRAAQVVATGGVKDFGDGDLDSYAEWSENVGGEEWKEKRDKAGDAGAADEAAAKGDNKKGSVVNKFELVGFAVSPHVQSKGLGVRVLDDVAWLTSMYRPGTSLRHIIDGGGGAGGVEGVEISGSASVQGFDMKKLREAATRVDMEQAKPPMLVLMAVRELGTESYYERRGFRTKWTGTVPVGMWACLKPCTMVYMERE